jgi:thioredoxin 2
MTIPERLAKRADRLSAPHGCCCLRRKRRHVVWFVGLTLDEKGILLRCSSCGQRNRLQYQTLDKEAQCGNCKTRLPNPAETIHVGNDKEFERLVSQSKLPVLVDFWADWCGPCKMVAPELEKVAAQAAGRIIVAKVNTEELQRTAARFSIASIPTMTLMRDGLEVTRISGARPARDILAFLEQNI